MEWVVSLTPEVSATPVDAVAAPPDGAGVIELRMDLMPEVDPRRIVAASSVPILVTVRSEAEGGRGPNDPEARRKLLEAARDSGAALIDLEADRDLGSLDRLGLDPDRVVLSWHDPVRTPPDLRARTERMLDTAARWVKVVPTARCLADVGELLALHQLHNRGEAAKRRLVAFSMGPVGLPSRYLSPLVGPPLAFAAWHDGASAAPGQLSIERLRPAIEHLSGAPQRIYAVVGDDAGASLSPIMHGAGYAELGLPYVFLPLTVLDPDELSLVFAPSGEGLFARLGMELSGLAVTRPHKTAALEAATISAPRARRARAANTIIPGPSRLLAENTDADGVRAALVGAGIDLTDRIAVIQGTGGAGRGAAVGLDLGGCEVFLRGRETQRTVRVSEALGVRWLPPNGRSHGASILVNATPLGVGETPPFTRAEIENAEVVVDLVYGMRTTPLVEQARRQKRVVVDGFEVLLYQGFAQFAAMTERLPPRDAMRAVVERFRSE